MRDRDRTSPTRPSRMWWAGAANPKTPAGQRHPTVVPSPAARCPRQPRRVPRPVVRGQRGFVAIAIGVIMRTWSRAPTSALPKQLTEVITPSVRLGQSRYAWGVRRGRQSVHADLTGGRETWPRAGTLCCGH